MRLIDADALRDEIAVLFERNPNLIDGWLAYAVEDTIDDAPTIDPVKHGRWIKWEGDVLTCSNCKHYWIQSGDQYDFNYCPYCGARMDEVEE